MAYKDPEERRAYHREWYKNNKEKMKEYRKTPDYRKSQTISKWKERGVIHDNFDALYEQYLEATHCNACKSGFKSTFYKCLDHDHTTGFFRQFLCRYCNNQDNWKKFISPSSQSVPAT
jgi:hypothetical protein